MSPKHAFSSLLLRFMRRNLFSFLQIIKAPRSFNKEAETRKVTCPFIIIFFFNFFIIRISRNCKQVHVEHEHSNFLPGDLHVDPDQFWFTWWSWQSSPRWSTCWSWSWRSSSSAGRRSSPTTPWLLSSSLDLATQANNSKCLNTKYNTLAAFELLGFGNSGKIFSD